MTDDGLDRELLEDLDSQLRPPSKWDEPLYRRILRIATSWPVILLIAIGNVLALFRAGEYPAGSVAILCALIAAKCFEIQTRELLIRTRERIRIMDHLIEQLEEERDEEDNGE